MNPSFISAIIATVIAWLGVYAMIASIRRRRIADALCGFVIAALFATLCMDRLLVGLMVELANASMRP